MEISQPTADGKIEVIAKDFDQMPNGHVICEWISYKEDRWQLEMRKCGCQLRVVYVTVCLDLFDKKSLNGITARISCADDLLQMCYKESFADWGSNTMLANFILKRDPLVKDLKFEVQLELNDTEWKPSPHATKLLGWFKSDNFGDVVIVASDGKKFRCQREFLAHSSPVFSRMFNAGVNGPPAEVKIEDFEGEIVSNLLLFIYTDDCKVETIADQLYAAAHKYQLDGLKIRCETALVANLSANSLVQTYQLANRLNLDDLKVKCVAYLNTSASVAHMSMSDLMGEAFWQRL